MKCPLCGITAKTKHGLRKHLQGQRRRGGHDMSPGEAERVAAEAAQSVPGPAGPPRTGVAAEVPDVPDNPYAQFMLSLLQSLARNRAIPKYALERRVDALIAEFLPDILASLMGWEVEVVTPEFPLRKPDSNQSTNVDYLLFRRSVAGQANGAWVFFELKTDDLSIRQPQLDTYRTAVGRGMPELLKELGRIVGATNRATKYGELLRRLDGFPSDRPIEVVYLTPSGLPDHSGWDGLHSISFAQLRHVQVRKWPEVWALFVSVLLPALG